MLRKFDLGFTLVEVHEDYIQNTIEEGYHVTLEDNNILIEFVKEYFKDKPFVYIANRVNSYSVDPTVYLETSEIKNLIGLAVVSSNLKQKRLIEFEKAFYKKDLKYFNTTEEALVWKDLLLINYRTKQLK